MSFQDETIQIGTSNTTIVTCPVGQNGSVYGLVFSNLTNTDVNITISLYSQSTGLTTQITNSTVVPANDQFTWPKPINVNAGDQIIASAATANAIVAVASVYYDNSINTVNGFNPRGNWSSSANYAINDVVTYSGSSYIAVSPNIGTPPPSNNWMLNSNGTATSAQYNSLGIPLSWNANTNTPTLISSTADSQDNCYVVSVAGTTNLDGFNTWNVGDIAYFNGLTWNQIVSAAIPNSTVLMKGNGTGGLVPAISGIDYTPAPSLLNGVPIGIAPSGTMSNNGVFTFSSPGAFNKIYSDGIWLYFIAGSINSGSLAGFYWVVMSSTTTGIVYNNTYTPGTNLPNIPTSLIPFVTVGSGIWSTISICGTYITFAETTIPANTLGNNGVINGMILASYNSNSNNKLLNTILGSTSIGITQFAYTTGSSPIPTTFGIINRGRPDRQQGYFWSANGGNYAVEYASENTANSKTLQLQFGVSSGCVNDFIIAETYTTTISHGS